MAKYSIKFNDEDFNNYLEHHGIKGQKWGVRRSLEELGYKVGQRRKRRAMQARMAKLRKAKVRKAKIQAKNEKKALKRHNKIMSDPKLMKKHIDELSNEDIESYVTKINNINKIKSAEQKTVELTGKKAKIAKDLNALEKYRGMFTDAEYQQAMKALNERQSMHDLRIKNLKKPGDYLSAGAHFLENAAKITESVNKIMNNSLLIKRKLEGKSGGDKDKSKSNQQKAVDQAKKAFDKAKEKVNEPVKKEQEKFDKENKKNAKQAEKAGKQLEAEIKKESYSSPTFEQLSLDPKVYSTNISDIVSSNSSNGSNYSRFLKQNPEVKMDLYTGGVSRDQIRSQVSKYSDKTMDDVYRIQEERQQPNYYKRKYGRWSDEDDEDVIGIEDEEDSIKYSDDILGIIVDNNFLQHHGIKGGNKCYQIRQCPSIMGNLGMP